MLNSTSSEYLYVNQLISILTTYHNISEEVSLSMMISSNGGPVGNTAIVDTAAFIVKTGFFNKVPSKDLYRAATAATCLGTPNTAVLQILHLPAEYKVDGHPVRQLYYDLGAGQHQRRCLGLSDGPLFGLTVDRLAVRVYVSWWEQDLVSLFTMQWEIKLTEYMNLDSRL